LKILIANKMDFNSESKVSKENGIKLAENNGMIFMETSAKDCSGIKELDLKIGTELLSTIKKLEMG
jgi:tRNA U34 5-carboxymethylaminomethyl modifying GTPase MnmE/TrmE